MKRRSLAEASSSAGFTLIEMLVAMACTLVLMAAVVNLFGEIGDSVSNSRGMIEISERLRSARNRLQLDLQGVTAKTLPPLRPESDEGYLEIIEGINRDTGTKTFLYADFAPGDPGYDLTGDADDVVMFTTHSRGQPFVGRFEVHAAGASTTIESEVAEVAWYAVEEPMRIPNVGPKLYTLYRRVLLVSPRAASSIASDDLEISTLLFQHVYDLSARWDGAKIRLNTLGDLTKRENRWWHFPNGNVGFPYPVPSNPFHRSGGEVAMLQERSHEGSIINRTSEDIVLTNVLAFDVKVFDPDVPLRTDSASGAILTPSDPGYGSGSTSTFRGGFVDLNYNNDDSPPNAATSPGLSRFSWKGEQKSGLRASGGPAVYDTWSMHYENNFDSSGVAIDEDSANNANGAVNGFDDNNNNVIDDIDERDTLPPYMYPLRGIQVKIRVYEPDSRQVREVTVVEDFLPE